MPMIIDNANKSEFSPGNRPGADSGANMRPGATPGADSEHSPGRNPGR